MSSNDETDAATPQQIDLAEFEDLQHSWRTRSGIYDELFSHWISDRKEEIMAELKRCYERQDMANEAMLNAREVLMKHHEWMSMSDATSEEDDQEILDVVKALREASE